MRRLEVARALDNTAKVFSLDEKKNNNIYQIRATLSEEINPRLLKKALELALTIYPSYKVRKRIGLFWNYFDRNDRNPMVEKKTVYPNQVIRFKRSNDYLFKLTYDGKLMNLDVLHMLTDGSGALIFFKAILYCYLSLRYSLKNPLEGKVFSADIHEDSYLKIVDKTLKDETSYQKAYLIKKESNPFKNYTTHIHLDLDSLKKICKRKKVTITEYLTALYLYAIYQTIYDKKKNRDIVINIPIDLRKIYGIESYANFFTCMCIKGNVLSGRKVTVENLLTQIHEEFQKKLTKEKIPTYLARDVRLGTNVAIRFVPLFIKKLFMKYMGHIVGQTSTTTLSNLGAITLEEEFYPYVENIKAIVNPGRIQRVKCTVSSYQKNLTVTLNSSLLDHSIEREFYRLLKKQVKNVSLESDTFLS